MPFISDKELCLDKDGLLIGDYLLTNYCDMADDQKEMVRAWRNDDRVREWMYGDHVISAGEHKQFLHRLNGDNHNRYYLVTCIKENKDLGSIYFNKIDRKNRSAYMGLYSNPDIRGVGDALSKLALKVARSNMNVQTVMIEALADNVRAINLYRRAGFVEVSRLTQHSMKGGELKDVIVMKHSEET